MGYGGAVLFLAALSAYHRYDLSTNYTPVEAEVISVEKDCYIEGHRKKIVIRDTNKLAYMDCDLAPEVAEEYGMSRSHIWIRYQITYSYQDPKEGGWYEDSFTDEEPYTRVERNGEDPWYEGRVFKVFVHKKNPERSRVVTSDLEFDDGES